MIKVNNPRVKILIGRVKTISIGRKNALNTPRTAAARKALIKLLTSIPLIRYEVSVMDAASISHLMTIPFISDSPLRLSL